MKFDLNHPLRPDSFPFIADNFQKLFTRSEQLANNWFADYTDYIGHDFRGLTIRNSSDLSKLNDFVKMVEQMGEKDMQIFSGAMKIYPPIDPDGALRLARSIDRYELIEGAVTKEKLGRWLVEHEHEGQGVPKAALPHLPLEAIGEDYAKYSFGAFAPAGFVRPLDDIPEQEEIKLCLVISKVDKIIYLDLPSTSEALDRAKRSLDVDGSEEMVYGGFGVNWCGVFFGKYHSLGCRPFDEAYSMAMSYLETAENRQAASDAARHAIPPSLEACIKEQDSLMALYEKYKQPMRESPSNPEGPGQSSLMPEEQPQREQGPQMGGPL